MKTVLLVSVLFVSISVVIWIWAQRTTHSGTAIDASDVVATDEAIADHYKELRAQNARMTHEQILERARNDMQVKTSAHTGVWRFGEEERWDFSADEATLTFTFPDKTVRARAQLVGSYVYSRRSWLWSWANRHMPAEIKHDAEITRKHLTDRRVHGFDREEWFIDETEAWDLTALTGYLSNAEGVYSGRDGDMRAFFTFHNVSISRR